MEDDWSDCSVSIDGSVDSMDIVSPVLNSADFFNTPVIVKDASTETASRPFLAASSTFCAADIIPTKDSPTVSVTSKKDSSTGNSNHNMYTLTDDIQYQEASCFTDFKRSIASDPIWVEKVNTSSLTEFQCGEKACQCEGDALVPDNAVPSSLSNYSSASFEFLSYQDYLNSVQEKLDSLFQIVNSNGIYISFSF